MCKWTSEQRERGNSQESAGRFQGVQNSRVSQEAKSFSPSWGRTDVLQTLPQSDCGLAGFQSSWEQMLIGSTCCQRDVGVALVVANNSRFVLRLMITIIALAVLWSDGFIQKLSVVISQRQYLQLFILSSAVYSQSPWRTATSTAFTRTSLAKRTCCYLWKPSIKTGLSRPSICSKYSPL